MLFYIAADHRGFKLKESLKEYLKKGGYQVWDYGNEIYDENDDFPIFVKKVAEKISMDPQGSRGIVICGSGAGADIVANKFPKVRSVVAINAEQVASTRSDDDTNVLTFASNYIEEEEAKRILGVWMATPFSEEGKYKRRLGEIEIIEWEKFKQE
ncbi:MAG: RpiB/LacA/LacB family sugar-phosphate isomerase [Candidatus Pacebacteria bacterium]|nr:RpiB/LacA/LacB family sugar-phosphate isomerase [Candidatus Paceibacterota bacterium]